MRRYRTEIVIPADRFVGLQLPMHLPLGRAIVTVTVEEAEPDADHVDAETDREDIEWWEEFGEEGHLDVAGEDEEAGEEPASS